MTVDVVVACYKQERYLPLLGWGLHKNAQYINRAIFVNDEPWRGDLDYWPVDTVFLDHEHDGFGLSKSINQGMRAATTDYVLIVEGDEVLAPRSLERTLCAAKPHTALFCPKRYIEEPPSGFEPPEHWLPKFYPQVDHRIAMDPASTKRTQPYAICSGGHILVHRKSHEAIGGFDERYGYGLHDYDYGMRWMTRYGVASVLFSPKFGDVWHIGTNVGRALPDRDSQSRFRETLVRFNETSAMRGNW